MPAPDTPARRSGSAPPRGTPSRADTTARRGGFPAGPLRSARLRKQRESRPASHPPALATRERPDRQTRPWPGSWFPPWRRRDGARATPGEPSRRGGSLPTLEAARKETPRAGDRSRGTAAAPRPPRGSAPRAVCPPARPAGRHPGSGRLSDRRGRRIPPPAQGAAFPARPRRRGSAAAASGPSRGRRNRASPRSKAR